MNRWYSGHALGAIRTGFDHFARLPDEGWSDHSHYQAFLLPRLPVRCGIAFDIACGTGAFSRLLSERGKRVIAVDLLPQMVRIAKDRSRQRTDIDLQGADARSWPCPAARADCIASIAFLHHLPVGEMPAKLPAALRPGGTLAILELCEPSGLVDMLVEVAALPLALHTWLIRTRRLRQARDGCAPWQARGCHDHYLTLPA